MQDSSNPIAHFDGPKPFIALSGVNTVTAVTSDVILNNLKHSLTLGHPKLTKMPEFKIPKGDLKIALVGGGPSLKDTVKELKDFDTVVACGSSNDFLVSNGIIPTYTIVCDPDPVTIKYLSLLNKSTKYLLATCCAPEVFEHLKGYDIYVWNCHSPEQAAYLKTLDEPYEAICGGCTVGLRAQSIAIMFGYRELHFFGYDSCISGNDHHAYEFATQEEREQIGTLHEVKIGHGTPDDKLYLCIGYQMAQAAHFKDFYEAFNEFYNPTFHGEGLLPDLMKIIRKRSIELEKEMAA